MGKYYINFPEPKADIPITIYYIANCKPCEDALKCIKECKFNNKFEEPLLFMAINAGEMGKILEEKHDFKIPGRILFDNEIKKIIRNTYERTLGIALKGNSKSKNKIQITDDKLLTFPIIFNKLKYIGGYTELIKLV